MDATGIARYEDVVFADNWQYRSADINPFKQVAQPADAKARTAHDNLGSPSRYTFPTLEALYLSHRGRYIHTSAPVLPGASYPVGHALRTFTSMH